MNVKKAIKKVFALGVGVSMVGATLLGATASPYDLGDFPSPFVKDGMFNGLMVVGDDAAPADIIGVTDIAMSLQYSSTIKEIVNVGGDGGLELGGDSFKIKRAGDVLELGEYLGDVVETITDADAAALESFTVSNDKGTTDVDQYLKLNWDDDKSNSSVVYTKDEDDNVGDFLQFKDGDAVFQYELEFVEGFESDIEDGALQDLEDETIHMLGQDFSITDASLSDAGLLSISMMGGAIHDTIEEGETKTYTLRGKEYEVTALIISDWAGATGGSAKVKLKINGEVTKELQEGDTEILNDGTTLGVREVLPNEAGETAGGDIMEFYLGANKMTFEDSNAVSFTKSPQINDETIEDAKVEMSFSNSSSRLKLSKIAYRLNVDGLSGAEPYAAPGQGLREHLDEPEGMLADTWDIRYEGLSDPGVSEIRVKASGDDEYRLDFTNTKGIEYGGVRLLQTNGTDLKYGDDDHRLVFGQTLTAGDKAEYTIWKGDYFVVSHNKDSDTGVSNVLKLDSLDEDSELIQVSDVGTGDTISAQYTPGCTITTAGACTGQLQVGGFTYDFAVTQNASTGDQQVMLLVDLEDSNSALTSDDPVEAGLVAEGGAKIDLRSGGTYATGYFGTTVSMDLVTEQSNFDEATADETLSVDFSISSPGANGEVDLDVPSDPIISLDMQNHEDNDQLKSGMTKYGILVEVVDEDNDPNTLDISYPMSQLLPQVFVTFDKAVSLEDGASGSITVEKPQRIEIGSAVLASQVSDPTAVNVISVGGSCINSVTAEIMGKAYPACGADSGLSEDMGIVKLYESGDKVAIVVAGWEAADTTRATRVLADFKTYQESGQLVGTEVKVSGTSATEFTVSPVTAEEPMMEEEAPAEE